MPVTIKVASAITDNSPDCVVKTLTNVVNNPAAAFKRAGLKYTLASSGEVLDLALT